MIVVMERLLSSTFLQWEILPNETFVTKSVVHTGQLFFEDDLNMAIDGVHPYTDNPLFHDTTKHGRTRNWRDSLNIFDHAHEGGHNPVFEVHKLNGVLEQGFVCSPLRIYI